MERGEAVSISMVERHGIGMGKMMATDGVGKQQRAMAWRTTGNGRKKATW